MRLYKNNKREPYQGLTRKCDYCSERFTVNHGLEHYCREKNGIPNFCRSEQKKLFNEKKLAELVITLNNQNIQLQIKKNPLTKNENILAEILGIEYEKIVASDLLDSLGYDILIYSHRVHTGNSNDKLVIGNLTIEWIGQNESISIFKIKKK